MRKIIKDKAIVSDDWNVLKLADGETPDGVTVPAGKQIVPLAVWLAQKTTLAARSDVGVWFASDERPEQLKEDAKSLPVIAVDFPNFADGRGYSIAYNLRARLGFEGELRAIGDVLRDQLFYMTRCGFDAFALRDDQDPQVALTAFGDFSAPYQPAIDDGVRLGTPGTTRVGGALAQLAVNPW